MYYSLTDKLSDSIISDIPGIKAINKGIIYILGKLDKLGTEDDGERWIQYQGAHILLDPTDHVSKYILNKGYYERSVGDVLKNQIDTGDTVFEIGSHIGNHSITIRQQVGESGRVDLFEPHPESGEFLEQTIERNDWENVYLHRIAISDSNGTVVLSEKSSTNKGSASIVGQDKDSHSYEVKASRLINVIESLPINQVDLCKIDVEGAEYKIIQDIGDIVHKVDKILMEVHVNLLSEKERNGLYRQLDQYGSIETFDGGTIDFSEWKDIDEDNIHIVWYRDFDNNLE
jgi:FkbM family methyltransferase